MHATTPNDTSANAPKSQHTPGPWFQVPGGTFAVTGKMKNGKTVTLKPRKYWEGCFRDLAWTIAECDNASALKRRVHGVCTIAKALGNS